jgi:antitoxin component YwqK of YwqJK toxin-antitoxin module
MKYFVFMLLLPGFWLGPSKFTFGQDEEKTDPDSSGVVKDRLLPTSTPVLLFSDSEEEKKEGGKVKKKKKKKKNVFYGERTRKTVIKSSFRDQVTYQVFHFTTADQKVDPYIRDIYWYDSKNKAIKSSGFQKSKGYLLHGPYERRIGENVLETGMYYYGTKHGRWMSYDSKNILLDKKHYSEGWPKDSRVTYYNRGERQIEKLTPIEYELEEGNFFHFYQNGQVAVTGEYNYGEKVGLWTEFWHTQDQRNIKKREIQYQNEPFMNGFRPYIRAEWDEEGNLIYRNQ